MQVGSPRIGVGAEPNPRQRAVVTGHLGVGRSTTRQKVLSLIVPALAQAIVAMIALMVLINLRFDAPAQAHAASAAPVAETAAETAAPEGREAVQQQEGELVLDITGSLKTLANQSITYTLLVSNNSDLALSNVIITNAWGRQTYNGNYELAGDLMGATSTYFFTSAQPYMAWYWGSLPPRAAGSIVMTMWVPPSLQPMATSIPTVLPSVGVITHSTAGVSGTRDVLESLVIGPVISFTQTYTPAVVRPGRPITYVFRVSNASDTERPDSIAATSVVVSDKVPLYADLLDVTGTATTTVVFTTTPRSLKWFFDQALGQGETAYLTLTLRVSETIRNGGDVTNRMRQFRNDFGFSAAELPVPLIGTSDLFVAGDDVIEKMVRVGPPLAPFLGTERSFPNRIITYFVTVYNPLTMSLSGFRLTDTMPLADDGIWHFRPLNTFAVAPYPAPTVVVSDGRLIAWDMPAVGGWGVYTFGVRALVPTHMSPDITPYENPIEATSPLVRGTKYDNLTPPEARVRVVTQIELDASATPYAQLPGRPVTYTVKTTNVGDTTIRNASITATISPYFRYLTMIVGPTPIITSPEVGWRGITLSAYSGVTYTFTALAYGPVGNTCITVRGYSPDTYIPTATNKACMQMLSPFRIDKAALPSTFVLSETFSYRISLSNIGLEPATVNRLTDVLLPGFYKIGGTPSPTYTAWFTPPITLAPNAEPVDHTFNVHARTLPRNLCDKLPGNIPQDQGAVQFGVTSPAYLAGNWFNADQMGYAYIQPHVRMTKNAALPGAAPGEPITYTLWLTNNTPYAVPGLIITDILPAGFQYLTMTASRPPDQVISGTNQYVIWRNVNLGVGVNGVLSITFAARASLVLAEGVENKVQATSAVNPEICVPWLGFGGPTPGARINVRNKRLMYAKTVSPTQVSKLGVVSYDVFVRNSGPYKIYNAIITDILPYHPTDPGHPFRYIAMKTSTPNSVTLISTNPLAWRIAALDPDRTISFGFYAQATTYAAINYMNFLTMSVNSGWNLLPESYFLGAPVEVLGTIARFSPSELLISKSANTTFAGPGERITYTILITNSGPYTASTVVVDDDMPAVLTQLTVRYSGLTLTTTQGSTFTWWLPSLIPDQQGIITVSGVISEPLSPQTFTNTVTIDTRDGLDPQLDNNVSTVEIIVPNVPPVIQPIGDRIAYPGQLLTISVRSHDPNGDPITFTLDVGAPDGAAIDPVTGLFSWTPPTQTVQTETPHAESHYVNVRVTDDAEPPLNNYETFAIRVMTQRLYLPRVIR